MSRTRKLSVEISGEDKSAGKALKGVGDDADRLSRDLKKAGAASGKGFGDGWRSNMPSKKDAEGIGESLSGGLKKALAAGGIAAAAVFAVGFMQHLDNEFAVDKLEAQLGNGEWAKDAGEVAADLYLNAFGDSMSDTSAVVKGVIQFDLVGGEETKADLEDMSTLVATFTDVLDQDLNMTLQATSAMLRNGLAKDGEEALDILTTGIQVGADRAEDLLETFQEYSSLFRDLGLDGKKALGLIRQGLQGGARDADKVADALKEFAIRGQDASTLSAQGFKILGINAEEATAKIAAGGEGAAETLDLVLDRLREMEDPVQRNAAAVALFGTQAEDLGDALFALDLDTATQALGDMEGQTDELASAYDNAKTTIETFKRQALEKVTTFIGEEVIPRIEDFVGWLHENEGAAKILAIAVGTVLVGAMLIYAASAIAAAAATIAATWPVWLAVAAVAAFAAIMWLFTHREGEGFLQWLSRMAAYTILATQVVANFFQTMWSWAMLAWSAIQSVIGALDSLYSKLSSAPGGGILNGIIGGMPFGPLAGVLSNATGGPVMAGVASVVGERGRELFIPAVDGTIIPNHRFEATDWGAYGAGDGGGDTYVTNVYVSGSVLAERDLKATISRIQKKGL